MAAFPWNHARLKAFKKAYAKATGNVFIFEGHQFVTAYAKYLIQYLEKTL